MLCQSFEKALNKRNGKSSRLIDLTGPRAKAACLKKRPLGLKPDAMPAGRTIAALLTAFLALSALYFLLSPGAASKWTGQVSSASPDSEDLPTGPTTSDTDALRTLNEPTEESNEQPNEQSADQGPVVAFQCPECPDCSARHHSASGPLKMRPTLCWPRAPGAITANVSMVMIGDSVDRYMLLEWCEQEKHHRFACTGNMTKNPGCLPMKEFVNGIPEKDRYRSAFALYACYDKKINVSILLISNMFGTATHMTGNCHKHPDPAGPPEDIEEAWKSILSGFFARAHIVLGGPPDTLMLQSLFWDFKRARSCANDIHNLLHLGPKAEEFRRLWIEDWARNATGLLRASLSLASENKWPLRWAAWRVANHVEEDRQRWRFQKSNYLISAANAAASKAASKLGIKTFAYFMDFTATRDGVHPTQEASVEAMERVLQEAGACQWLPDGAESESAASNSDLIVGAFEGRAEVGAETTRNNRTSTDADPDDLDEES